MYRYILYICRAIQLKNPPRDQSTPGGFSVYNLMLNYYVTLLITIIQLSYVRH